jgi:transposase-like protein
VATKPHPRKATAAKAPRKESTPGQRGAILAEAKEVGLTGKQVASRHGISTVTYYLWKKRPGMSGRGMRRAPLPQARRNGLSGGLRAVVQAKIREVLPEIVKSDVSRALDWLLGRTHRPGH